MPRLVYGVGVGVAVVAAALAFTDLALRLQPGATAANVRLLRPGMTLQEVEAVLGGGGVCDWAVGSCSGHNRASYRWSGAAGVARVTFTWRVDRDPAVWETSFERAGGGSPLARILSRLGL